MEVTPYLLIFCWLIDSAILELLCKKQYSQIPVKPGSIVTMPCRFTIDDLLRSKTSVSWQLTNGTDVLVVAHSNVPDDDDDASQHQHYKGRARVQPEWPIRGHPDLLMHDVSDADFGNYTCYITFDEWVYECSSVTIYGDQRNHLAGLTGENIFIIALTAAYVLVAVMTIILVRCSCSCPAKSPMSERKDA